MLKNSAPDIEFEIKTFKNKQRGVLRYKTKLDLNLSAQNFKNRQQALNALCQEAELTTAHQITSEFKKLANEPQHVATGKYESYLTITSEIENENESNMILDQYKSGELSLEISDQSSGIMTFETDLPASHASIIDGKANELGATIAQGVRRVLTDFLSKNLLNIE